MIETERMADQKPGVEFRRIETGSAEFRGPSPPRIRNRECGARGPASASPQLDSSVHALGRKLRRLVVGDQRVDDLAQRLALHDLR